MMLVFSISLRKVKQIFSHMQHKNFIVLNYVNIYFLR